MLALASSLVAQSNFVELRGASTQYRYSDWMYSSPRNLVIDVCYIGTPGANEFDAGLGYQLKPLPSLTLFPLVYTTITKEGDRGAKLALLASLEVSGWKANAYLAQNWAIAGNSPSYLVLDTLDITHPLGKRLEVGGSLGFFHQTQTWNPQLGPLVKLNDQFGSWVVSWRMIGPQKEFRVGRTLAFGK